MTATTRRTAGMSRKKESKMKQIKNHIDKLRLVLGVFSISSVVYFAVGLCMYGDWIRTLKLYNAGLLTKYSVEFYMITCYEPAIKAMSMGAIFGILSLSLLAITKKIKNDA